MHLDKMFAKIFSEKLTKNYSHDLKKKEMLKRHLKNFFFKTDYFYL